MESILSNAHSLEQLDTVMDGIIDNWTEYSQDERNRLVELYIERMWEMVERRPKQDRLTELTDFLLMEELTNPHPDKMSRTEYPILTKAQVIRRERRTVWSGEEAITDFLNIKYNTWKTGSNTHIHKKITTDKRE